jgi:methionine-rich copper-binding protein CopC
MSALKRLLLTLLIAMLAALVLTPAAPTRARTVVIKSEPADGALLAEAPRSVQLWFNHAATIAPEDLLLTDGAGKAIEVLGIHAEPFIPQDLGLESEFDATFLYLCATGAASWPTRVMVHLPELPAGAYQLSWRSMGLEDRRTSEGTLVFSVEAIEGVLSAAPLNRSAIVDDMLISLAVQPNRPGDNFFNVRVVDRRRPERAAIDAVTLVLTPPGAAAPVAAISAEPAGEGRYRASSALMAVPGDWGVDVVVRREGMADTTMALDWELASARAAVPWGSLGLALGGFVCVVSLAAFISLRRP